MERAREAIHQITGRRGHETTVEETVAPAITKEEIKPTRHEEITEAIDREVHQDHFHTTIQPIQHQEILPETHHHRMKDMINKEFHHGNDEEVRLRLERERAQFRDEQVVHEARETTAAAPAVAGEHVHHHVHEIVQPIIHKETITPEVVHTTVPIHETHHASAQVHGVSVLPMKTLDEFTSTGGAISGTGRTTAHETYEGPPRPYNREMQIEPTDADLNPTVEGIRGTGMGTSGTTGTTGTTGHTGHTGTRGTTDTFDNTGTTGTSGTRGTTSGTHRSNVENELDPRVDSNSGNYDDSTSTGTGTSGTKKPSLLSRLNPLKDSDGDGKRGIND